MPLLKKIIFGKRTFESEEMGDKFLLAGYFLLMYICIDIFFLAVNLFHPFAGNFPILLGMLITVSCMILLRLGWRNTAILVQLIRTNFIAFYFSTTDQELSGNFLYYMVSGIGAMALYGYEERGKGIAFSLISLALFYLSLFRAEEFSPEHNHFFFVMNFTVTYLMSFVIIYFLNQLTYLSRLKEREKKIQLEKVNAELDRFVYSVSHDLRAPLSSISGLIQLSERSRDWKEIEQYLTLMKDRIDRLEKFIRDIINFSRNARGEIRLESVNLKDLTDEIFETLKFVSGAETIELRNSLSNSLSLPTDRARLQVVLFNLISNAIQYRDNYKTQSYISLTSKERNGNLVLTLEDNGLGIDPAHHDKVYNMFYRASHTSKGSGLGLYIVKETMEKLGGSISLQSVLGEGTHFILELPLQKNHTPSSGI